MNTRSHMFPTRQPLSKRALPFCLSILTGTILTTATPTWGSSIHGDEDIDSRASVAVTTDALGRTETIEDLTTEEIERCQENSLLRACSVLNIDNISIDEDEAAAVGEYIATSFTVLTKLKLSNEKNDTDPSVVKALLTPLQKHPTLQNIVVRNISIEDNTIDIILNTPCLYHLDITQGAITLINTTNFVGRKGLMSLKLSHNQIDDKGAEIILEHLRHKDCSIHDLDLSGNKHITPGKAAEILDVYIGHPTLENLALPGVHLGTIGTTKPSTSHAAASHAMVRSSSSSKAPGHKVTVESLDQSLPSLMGLVRFFDHVPFIKAFDITDGKSALSVQGGLIMACVAASRPHLTLKHGRNKITGEMLTQSTKIELSGLFVGSGIINNALPMILQAPILTHLDLSKNNLTDDAATPISQAFLSDKLSSLVHLNLSGNPVGTKGLRLILSAIGSRDNLRLETLDISETKADDMPVFQPPATMRELRAFGNPWKNKDHIFEVRKSIMRSHPKYQTDGMDVLLHGVRKVYDGVGFGDLITPQDLERVKKELSDLKEVEIVDLTGHQFSPAQLASLIVYFPATVKRCNAFENTSEYLTGWNRHFGMLTSSNKKWIFGAESFGYRSQSLNKWVPDKTNLCVETCMGSIAWALRHNPVATELEVTLEHVTSNIFQSLTYALKENNTLKLIKVNECIWRRDEDLKTFRERFPNIKYRESIFDFLLETSPKPAAPGAPGIPLTALVPPVMRIAPPDPRNALSLPPAAPSVRPSIPPALSLRSAPPSVRPSIPPALSLRSAPPPPVFRPRK